MLGVILAAGYGSRLRPDTDRVPKTLLPVDAQRTILDVILANLATVGVKRVAVLTGHRAEAIEARQAELADRYDVELELIRNDRVDRNNCYSLWLARDHFADGALVVNGDTVHPVAVEQELLAGADDRLLLALDAHRPLTDEAMKVRTDPAGRVRSLTKALPVDRAHGEYLGVCRIPAVLAGDVAAALHETWQCTPDGYYEDGFQRLADAGGPVYAHRLPELSWVEVDDHADLARARTLACRY
jgi:choline kinase